jgi:FAD:protein FMN transferase
MTASRHRSTPARRLRGAALLFACAMQLGCVHLPARVDAGRLAGRSMGTTWSVVLYAPDSELAPLQSRIDAELLRLAAQMSTWEKQSALSAFNRSTGDWRTLPEDTFRVVAHALALARDTDGAYDPTVGPLVNLWGFGPDGAPRSSPPDSGAIARARRVVGWHKVELDGAKRRARQPGGMQLDISSLGPGYAVDQMSRLLDSAGIASYLVELGGEMRSRGRKPDGSAWRVGVERPDDSDAAGEFDLVIALEDEAVGSSGDYRVGFEFAGRRYSHTIDPRNGEPVRHPLTAVTVVAASAMQADAWAAALMVLGPQAGWEFARRHQLAAAFTVRQEDGGYVRRLTRAFEARRQP